MGQVYETLVHLFRTRVHLDMNSVQFTSPTTPTAAHIWRVSKSVHHGQVVKEYLDKYGYNKTRVAQNSHMAKQTLNGLLKRAQLPEEDLVKLSRATNHDFVEDIHRRERESLKADTSPASPQYTSTVADHEEHYGNIDGRPIQVIVISPGDEEYAKKIAELLTKKSG